MAEQKVRYWLKIDDITDHSYGAPKRTSTYEHQFPGGKLVLVESTVDGIVTTSLVFVPETQGK